MSREENLRAIARRKMQEVARALRYRNLHVTLAGTENPDALAIVGVTPGGREMFRATLSRGLLARSREVAASWCATLGRGQPAFAEWWARDVPEGVKEDVRETVAAILREQMTGHWQPPQRRGPPRVRPC